MVARRREWGHFPTPGLLGRKQLLGLERVLVPQEQPQERRRAPRGPPNWRAPARPGILQPAGRRGGFPLPDEICPPAAGCGGLHHTGGAPRHQVGPELPPTCLGGDSKDAPGVLALQLHLSATELTAEVEQNLSTSRGVFAVLLVGLKPWKQSRAGVWLRRRAFT